MATERGTVAASSGQIELNTGSGIWAQDNTAIGMSNISIVGNQGVGILLEAVSH